MWLCSADIMALDFNLCQFMTALLLQLQQAWIICVPYTDAQPGVRHPEWLPYLLLWSFVFAERWINYYLKAGTVF